MILLDHSFEMLLKAAIVFRGGRIRERRGSKTIGLDACVRKGLTDSSVKFLTENQALTIQAINGVRDACYHYYVDISEALLYFHAQAGMTLFRDLCRTALNRDLVDLLPERVLPLSSKPPMDLAMLFDHEAAEIINLLAPGRRRVMEAAARLKPLAILDMAIQGEKSEPSDAHLRKMLTRLKATPWSDVFPGVAALDTSSEGDGPFVQIRIDKKEGIPVRLVPENSPETTVLAVKRLNELDYYSLTPTDLQKKVEMTMPKMIALIRHLRLTEDSTYYKEFRMGKRTTMKRYSAASIGAIKTSLSEVNMSEIWDRHGADLRGHARRPHRKAPSHNLEPGIH
jgi:hypothetical protein